MTRQKIDLANRLWEARSTFRREWLAAETAVERAEVGDEEAQAGLPALYAEAERLETRYEGIHDLLRELLPPATPNALAARILAYEIGKAAPTSSLFRGDPIARPALEFLRPSLTGLIRRHVDKALDHPDWPSERLEFTFSEDAQGPAGDLRDADDARAAHRFGDIAASIDAPAMGTRQ